MSSYQIMNPEYVYIDVWPVPDHPATHPDVIEAIRRVRNFFPDVDRLVVSNISVSTGLFACADGRYPFFPLTWPDADMQARLDAGRAAANQLYQSEGWTGRHAFVLGTIDDDNQVVEEVV